MEKTNPLAAEGFADGVAMVSHDEITLTDTITIAEPIMVEANLKVKCSKCGKKLTATKKTKQKSTFGIKK